MQRPEVGLEIDGYRLEAELYRGGFSTLWRVSHPAQTANVVMKVPRLHKGLDSASVVGFETEAMILPRLSGPHVPRLIGQGGFDPMPYVVMEEIAGSTLYERAKVAPLPMEEVIDLARAMTEALHAVHRQNVIHLDLKPENMMQRPSGEVVLLDFGLSRHDQLPDLLAEEFSLTLGTYPYVAPEQLLGQRRDLRSDLFALGVVIYQLLTGRLPFGEPKTQAAVRARLWKDPEPPRCLRPDAPEWLQEIILRALEVDPQDRYQSAAQMGFDLTHPQQLRLTTRGLKEARDPWTKVQLRWWRRRDLRRFVPPLGVASQINLAPVYLLAVDLTPPHEPLTDQLLLAVKRMLQKSSDARIACVNVIAPEAAAQSIAQLIALKTWARSLELPGDRLNFSILRDHNPAAALIGFAQANRVDHILIGANAPNSGDTSLGSIAAQVAAEAPCSVSIIRPAALSRKGV